MLLLRLLLREWAAVLHRRKYLVMALLAPLLYSVVLSGVYWNKKLTALPITIIDQDHSALSRQITRALLASESFRPGFYGGRPEDFLAQSARGESYCCVVFPNNFERDVKRGKGAKVAVWLDGSNMLISNVAATAAGQVFGTYSAGVDIRSSLLRGRAGSQNPFWTVQPIRDEYRAWFNPALNSNYTNFMLMGLICISVQLLTLLLVAQSGARETEESTVGQLPGGFRGVLAIWLAKPLAYLLLMLPVCLIALGIPHWTLGVPCIGSQWLLVGMMAWFIFALCLVGFGVSALIGDTLLATELFALVAMPSYLLSGYTWPAFATPRAVELVAVSLPLTQFVMLVRGITMKGASFAQLQGPVTGLIVWTSLGVVLALAGAVKLGRTAAGQRRAVA